MFINLIKKSFVDVIKNPIITLLLVSYFIIISLLTGCINYQKNMIIICMLLITSFLFVAIFISGWLRVIKEISLQKPDEEKRNYMAMFLESIGENVIPVSIGLIIYITVSVILIIGAYLISIKFFGDPQELIKAAYASGNAAEYINNLPPENAISVYAFPVAILISNLISLFLFIYYFAAIIFNTDKNMFIKPFAAFRDNFCFLFKHFFMTVGFYLVLCLINCSFAVLKKHLPAHIAIDILYLFYIVYFLSFAVMLICNYYATKYSGNNRPDSIGENESDNNISEEN